jgi:hypothetical protein
MAFFVTTGAALTGVAALVAREVAFVFVGAAFTRVDDAARDRVEAGAAVAFVSAADAVAASVGAATATTVAFGGVAATMPTAIPVAPTAPSTAVPAVSTVTRVSRSSRWRDVQWRAVTRSPKVEGRSASASR